MQPKTTLPLDVLASIIDLLAAGNDPDTRSLRMLSQVCKSLVPQCRRHLFSSLVLDKDAGALRAHRFSDLLRRNPDIARYLKGLRYYPVNDLISDQRILEVLKERSSSLRSIELRSHSGADWNTFPESIRSSLVSLIQLPTITDLEIRSFTNFPATALSLCDHIIDLRLQDLEMTPPEINHVVRRSKMPTPVSLYARPKTYGALAALMQSTGPNAGGPIDFSCLRKASFDMETASDIYPIDELLKTTMELQSLSIMIAMPVELVGLGASLAANAHRTLRSAIFSYMVYGDHYDPLCGLSRELRMIAGNNVLEELQLRVGVQTDYTCRTESEEWSAFDAVITESGAFPMLGRVSVEIVWLSFYRDEDEAEDVLDSLDEDRFPRLLESTALEFTFSADHLYV
ncbi:hypothetical protein BDZ97DRAFT_1651420 [Flammula alnicola]|nr:hypothetical protein BDZ97DRAFT_1651420 [Flammula alnicola]